METKFKDKKVNFNTMNIIGCKAIAEEPIEEIVKKYNVTSEFVHEQKNRVLEALELRENIQNKRIIVISKILIERIIIACMLLCKASTEDCQRFLSLTFGISVSIGKISGIVSKAAEKAKIWNESVSLNGISVGANDEIFQGNKPILVGVDPKSTYIYLFQLVSNRDANTWGYSLLCKVENQGLWLTQAVSDAGKGIIRGTKDVFGESITYQADIFHVMYDFNKGLRSLGNYVYRCISEQNELLKKHSKNSISREKVEISKNKEITAIHDYDNLCIVFSWVRELLEIGGYFYDDRIELFKFIIVLLEKIESTNSNLKKSISFIKNNASQMLQFVKVAEVTLSKIAENEGISEEVLRKMWLQEAYEKSSSQYNKIEAEIGLSLGARYLEARQIYAKFKENITRASSMVECINSLIRPYINLKRSIPEKFTHLLHMYFNTRNYRRSRVENRCKKSPYELLTGKRCENLLDILCA